MKKLKEEILEEFNQFSTLSPKDRPTPSTSSSTGNSTPPTPSHQDQMILMSTALVYLLPLPLAFVYFLHVTLSSLKIKKSSIKKRSTTKTTSYALEKIYSKWVALIGKKHWRFYQGRIDQNNHHDRNILRTKGGKRKTTKGISGCHGYHETCWWNSGWCPCQGLCSLQKMDQLVMLQQTFYGPLKSNKIAWHHWLRRKRLPCFAAP